MKMKLIHHILNKKVGTAAMFVAVFGLTACTAFFMLPQTVITEREKQGTPAGQEEDYVLTGRERFIGNLASSAASGLAIDLDELVFTAEGKQGHENRIDASGATLDFALSSLSLHGVNFALNAPITYSDALNNPHRRSVNASMIDGTIYVDLEDLDNHSWDFKYKVDVKAKDMVDGNNEKVTDPVTGGIKQYEYGDLDFLIEDVFEILSEGGLDISLEGWLDKLSGGSEESSSEPSSSGIDTDAIMDSMSGMVETTHEGKPYFIWKLPLGNMTLDLGMRADEDYKFAGVDLPSLYDYSEELVEEEVVYNAIPNPNTSWEIQEGLNLSVHASIADFFEARHDWSYLVPEDASNYKNLMNSRYFLESIAKYVANPQFGVDVELDLGHSSPAKEGDRTHLAKEASSDSMRIALTADADLSERKFHGVQGQLSIQKLEESVIKARHDVNVAYLYDQQEKEGDGYLDINGELFKAHTTKTYLSEFYSSIIEGAFSSGSTQEQAEGENTLNQIREVLNKIGFSIDAIVESDLLKDISNGVYVSALDIIESIDTVQLRDDNENFTGESALSVRLTLAPIGLEGHVTLTLRGRANHADLLDLRFEGIKFASFTLDGSIKTRAFQQLKAKEEYVGYDDLSHLKGIGEQVTGIVNNHSFRANLGVNLSHEDEIEGTVNDLALNGDLRFAFADALKSGAIELGVEQNLTDKIAAHHKVNVDLRDDFSTVAFGYGSGNQELTALPEEAIKAKLSLGDLTDGLSGVLSSVTSLDDRFGRLSASLASETAPSLLGRITSGEYSALLEKTGLLSQADLHDAEGNTVIAVNKSALGLDEDLVVKVHYLDEQDKEGGIDYLSVDVPLSDKSLQITFGGIESVELEETVGESTQLKEGIENEFATFSSEQVESMKDISFLGRFLDYTVGTLTLGTAAGEDGNVSGTSYYGIAGDLSVDLGVHNLSLGLFDAYASVEGAETKIYANLEGIPVIRGVNAPDSDIYFRPNEAEGVRNSEIYYYANGIDPKGEALLTRDSSYGKVRNVRDVVRLDGEQFTGDPLGWLGRYSLGINDELLSTKSNTMGRHHRAGLLGDEPLRIETVINHFSETILDNGASYTLSVDLGKLVGIPLLGNAEITFTGRDITGNDASFKTLTGINIHADASAKAANSGKSMRLVAVDVDLYLNNIKRDLDSGNYFMENVWDDGYETSSYGQNFIASVTEEGNVTGGIMFDLPDSTFVDIGEETMAYSHNFVGQASINPSNLYLGI